MERFDQKVLDCFLKNQTRLFPKKVAETPRQARAFLEENMAVVADSAEDVAAYFKEEGVDLEGAADEEILSADEVFQVGDGRYLIVPF